VEEEMRDRFIYELIEIAKVDKNIILITGDLGFGVLDNFVEEFPAQFINAGVAEQDMTGIATGMALEGKTVFTYSICNFPTLRCLEQIRNDACYHQANVKIVAIGGGFCYGPLGISHHATEDLSIMRALPNITVVAPGDIVEATAATRAVYNTSGTCYLRLGRGGGKRVHEGDINFKIGKAIQLFDGDDIALISTGGILCNAFKARERLDNIGLSVGLYSMHTLKPFDREIVEDIAEMVKLIVTIEEHTVIGGLGGAVSEILAQMPQPRARLQMVGLPGCFSSVVGDQEYLRKVYGMSVEGIVEKVKGTFEEE
jgi:transketolase